MRRLLTFSCEGATLGATLDAGSGTIGLLMATGGSQSRIGSHRMYERLAKMLSEQEIPSFRFDRRGVGDSEGEDPGYRGSRPDLIAAATAFRREASALQRLFGFGLCDGATALALHGDAIGLDGLILVNPWLVEASADAPPSAAVRAHYRDRLLSLDGWKRLLGGAVDLRKLWRGIARLFQREDATLAAETAAALRRHRLPTCVILATGDATAIAARSAMKSNGFNGLNIDIQELDSDSHTFARPGDEAALAAAILDALRRLGVQAS
ncbi:MAG: hydrolase 1, exosortase A system-associated [Sphingomonas sp.]|nr:hydrolase 1, exosortase A system-associated [Sphingomonas sp.]